MHRREREESGRTVIGLHSRKSGFLWKKSPAMAARLFFYRLFAYYIYIYICTELRLWRIENGRGQKKKKGEPSQSQDNLPLKTFAKPRQRDRETLFVEMPVVPPRRLFVVEKSATGIHVVSSFVSAFLNAPHQKDESQRMRGGLLFPPSPFPLCPNSTLPSPSYLLMVSSRRRKTDEGGGEDYVRSIISRVMQYRG